MNELEDDNWLNKKYINCPSCNETLLVCDHSPFEHSYRLYCNTCPKRVDIGLYEPVYDEIESVDDLSYDNLLLEFEKRLEKCSCGGQFKLNAARKCLHCHTPLSLNEEQNVWLGNYWDETLNEEQEEFVEQKMQQFIVKPKWKSK